MINRLASKSTTTDVQSGYVELDASEPTDQERIDAYLRYRELDGRIRIEHYEELLVKYGLNRTTDDS